MARTVGIGIQCFDKIRENHYFYIDKTCFIKEWWESGDDVTLITRPRRFGKTLNMCMVEELSGNSKRTYPKLWFCISGETCIDRVSLYILKMKTENLSRQLKISTFWSVRRMPAYRQ